MAKPLRYAQVATRTAAAWSTLPSEARAVLRLCDGTRDLEELVAASPAGADRTPHIVARLKSLGLIEPARARPRRPTPPSVQTWLADEPKKKHDRPAPTPIAAAPLPAVVVAAEPAPAWPAGFTDQEEAFFAAPLPEELPWDESV